MPNKQLEDRSYKIPDKVINRVSQMINKLEGSDKQAKGLQRAKEMVEKRVISYSHMNRLKNYFDSYEGDGTDDEYKLVGGEVAKKWLEKSDLETEKDSLSKIKKAKMDAGIENTHHKDGYTRDRDNANPTKANGGMIDAKNSFKSKNIMSNDAIYQEGYNKEIDSIKYLMEYLNKNI